MHLPLFESLIRRSNKIVSPAIKDSVFHVLGKFKANAAAVRCDIAHRPKIGLYDKCGEHAVAPSPDRIQTARPARSVRALGRQRSYIMVS